MTGAPATRRIKTYSAQSGYVYSYYYQGQRRAGARSRASTEYVFTLSAGRAEWRGITLALPDAAMARWQEARGRELSSTERYAVAKMALFQTLDEHEVPEVLPREVRVPLAAIEAIAAALGWE
jgi:hypothetical protein